MIRHTQKGKSMMVDALPMHWVQSDTARVVQTVSYYSSSVLPLQVANINSCDQRFNNVQVVSCG